MAKNSSERIHGWLAAVGAYFLWGTLPFYWHFLSRISSDEVIALRFLGCVLFFFPLALWQEKDQGVRAVLFAPAKRRNLILFFSASLLVGLNWYGYIVAVNSGHVVEAGLGYYLNPILNVVVGSIVLKESLRKWQWVAFGFAGCGVTWLFVATESVPWISLFVAITFTLYGLVRKKISHKAAVASFWEALVLAPFALLYLVFLFLSGRTTLSSAGVTEVASLSVIGVVTGLPLLLFAVAVRRLSLSYLSFVQFLSPTLQFLIGVFVFHEAFDQKKLLGFVFIWIGIVVFIVTQFSTKCVRHS